MRNIKPYNGFLNESNDFKFTTTVDRRDVDYSNPELEKDQYLESADLKVDWELDLDMRDHGIKSFGVLVSKVYGFYNVVTPGDDNDDEREVEFVAEGKDWDLSSEFEGEFVMGTAFSPASVEVDLKSKKVIVKF